MTAGEFLTALWGNPPPGKVLVWTLPDKRSYWYAHFDNINQDLLHHPNEEIYTGVGIAPREGLKLTSGKRLLEIEIAGIAAFWADLDVAHAVHKKSERLPPTQELALEALALMPFTPTFIVESGHGLQIWWLLDEPWIFAGPEDRELARRATQWWHRCIQEAFKRRGWMVDSVFDLARVMRIPGTRNRKDPNEVREVRVLQQNEHRYTRQQFLGQIPENFQPTAISTGRIQYSPGQDRGNGPPPSSGLILSEDAKPDFLRMETLTKLDAKFRRTWERKRPDLQDQSPSSYDMALANTAVRAEWPDQEVVNLLIYFRRTQGFDLKLRENYYALTIRKAKEPLEIEHAQEQISEAINHPPEDQPDVLRDNLSTIFNVDILRIAKYQGDPPIYCMETQQGNLTLGNIGNVTSQRKFRDAVAAATRVMIPGVTNRVWEQRVQAILLACEEVDAGDASHPVRETIRWVEDYLLEKPAKGEENWEAAIATRNPFQRRGKLMIFMEDFRKWLEFTMGNPVDNHTMGRRFRQAGIENEQVHMKSGDAWTTRTCWVIPESCIPHRGSNGHHPDEAPAIPARGRDGGDGGPQDGRAPG